MRLKGKLYENVTKPATILYGSIPYDIRDEDAYMNKLNERENRVRN